jgi:hypothetical protein
LGDECCTHVITGPKCKRGYAWPGSRFRRFTDLPAT